MKVQRTAEACEPSQYVIHLSGVALQCSPVEPLEGEDRETNQCQQDLHLFCDAYISQSFVLNDLPSSLQAFLLQQLSFNLVTIATACIKQGRFANLSCSLASQQRLLSTFGQVKDTGAQNSRILYRNQEAWLNAYLHVAVFRCL